MNPIPVVFDPIFKTRPWGGRRLESLLHKHLPPGQAIGESWELVSLAGDESRVRGGPLAGTRLRELLALWGRQSLGDAEPVDGEFPLLIKFLDAAQDLSIQVHPKPAQRGGADPAGVKHEAWYVMHAEPGARILAGARDGATQADFERAAGRAETANLLRSWPARAGDCFYLPSGTPHALGAGIVVAEIQTPSDVTYRLYDWDRLGTDGRRRELHLEAGLANLRLDVGPDEILQPEPVENDRADSVRLCTCERFTIDRIRVANELCRTVPSSEPLVWIVLRGGGVLRNADCELRFGIGDVVLIPAASGTLVVENPRDVDLLEVHPS